ncbi:MAG: hypothetical protein A3J60_00335 [Candidatus Pacebacteria bacterium RIFCSPHIGHO2_02_FULL_46_9]|nr:MAG: hypothetical protein A3J60_00335 [Candidatus Pacebacteria bacterium RIFCSPHIGHO2_02_FULL_46_9]
MNIINQVLLLIGPSVLFGYLLKYYLDSKQSKKLEERNKRRIVYEDLAETLGIFISGRIVSIERKNKFLETYAKCWLWASDEVIKEINDFLDFQVVITKGDEIQNQDAKEKYAACVIAMRKDLGFSKTLVKTKDYKFVSF